MLKKHMAACLVVTAFAAAPALAQTTSPSAPTDRPAATGSGSTTSGSPAMQPGATGSSSMSQGTATKGQFMAKVEMNQIMASDLIGTRVVSANNESIGDINDVIVDRNGRAVAAVIGVGGFLGIGEKDVAVPFESLEFANAQQAEAMDQNKSGNAVTTTGSTATGTASGSSSTMATNNTSSTANTASSNKNEPERVVLRMTKAELQAAPSFDADGDNANTGSTGATGQSGTATTAPKQ